MTSSQTAWHTILAVTIRAGVAALVVLNGERVVDVQRSDLLKYPARRRRAVLLHAVQQLAADYSVSTVVAEPSAVRRLRLRALDLNIERATVATAGPLLLATDKPNAGSVAFVRSALLAARNWAVCAVAAALPDRRGAALSTAPKRSVSATPVPSVQMATELPGLFAAAPSAMSSVSPRVAGVQAEARELSQRRSRETGEGGSGSQIPMARHAAEAAESEPHAARPTAARITLTACRHCAFPPIVLV